MTRFVRATIAAALVAALTASDARSAERIVNGLDTQDFETTGALLYSGGGSAIDEDNASTQCSGTLIGCQTFLTAAHCVDGDTTASHYWVYLQHGGIHAVSSVTFEPTYDGSLSGNDVAVVKLASAVQGIDPTTFNDAHDLEAMGIGLVGTIAGFGQTYDPANDYGVKRYGDVLTADCTATGPEGTDVLVCWDYEAPIGAPGTDSNTCNGDSGGPLFMELGGETVVVGVTSAGSAADCLATDHSWDASVYHNRAWVDAQFGADSAATCGGLAAVGEPSVTVHKDAGTLSSGNADDYHEITLVGAPALLRVTLNGTDNGSFGLDFFVKEGAGASAADYDCKADGASVYGACSFTNPAAGTWSIFVRRTGGSGQYQVTSSIWGDPPVCGNDVAEFGEECDGADLGTCPVGPCDACACPAPVCGNDVIEEGETCDGTSDAACEGLCSACSCPAPVCGNDVLESGETCDGAADAACPGLCQGDCTCFEPCTDDVLYGVSFVADELRFSYKAYLFDTVAAIADLNPVDDAFEFDVVDDMGSVLLSIPAGDAGWIRADPVRRKYTWKGDGTLDGLKQVKLKYRETSAIAYWQLMIKGRTVTGAGSLNLAHVLDFRLGFDGTCHTDAW